MRRVRVVVIVAGVAALGACVPKRETPPPPQQQRPQAQPRPQPPAPPPPPADWREVALSPGGWRYSDQGGVSQASFGSSNQASFVVRCDRGRREISLWREGDSSGNVMTVRTSYGARNFPLSTQAQPTASVYASLAANDRFLDTIAFSRGRFTVEVPGRPMLVIPAWPEPARVVEDCRA
jgi:hypothetical protein